jgi:hypothetical protein
MIQAQKLQNFKILKLGVENYQKKVWKSRNQNFIFSFDTESKNSKIKKLIVSKTFIFYIIYHIKIFFYRAMKGLNS